MFSREYPPGFLLFWSAYACPRRVKKPDAFAQWQRLACEPDADVVLAAIERYKGTAQWRDGFMPEPARWLRSEPWDDEPVELPESAPESEGWNERFRKERGGE